MSEPVIPERLWITSYVAGPKSSILGRGLHFRSIQDSEADAKEHLRQQAKPGSEYPRADEYILASAAEAKVAEQAATIAELKNSLAHEELERDIARAAAWALKGEKEEQTATIAELRKQEHVNGR